MLLTNCVESENSSNNNAKIVLLLGGVQFSMCGHPVWSQKSYQKDMKKCILLRRVQFLTLSTSRVEPERLKIKNCILIGHHSPCCDHLVPTEPNAEWWLANERGATKSKIVAEKNNHFLITTLVEKNQKSIAPDVWLTVALRPQQ